MQKFGLATLAGDRALLPLRGISTSHLSAYSWSPLPGCPGWQIVGALPGTVLASLGAWVGCPHLLWLLRNLLLAETSSACHSTSGSARLPG